MTDNFVDFRTIKSQVSIEEVLHHYKIQLRKVNAHSLRGKCPLPTHSSEKSDQSFGVHLEKNIWACQSSSCATERDGRKGGNVIDLVSVMENISIRDSALKLRDLFLSATSATPDKKKVQTQQLVAAKVSEATEEGNKPLLFTLKGIDSGHPYLKERGIDEEVAKLFGVGFFPGRGLMSGRVVIPISNERGELIAYAGRAIDATEPKYKFPPGFKKSEVLFNFDRVLALPVESRDVVVVVEGFFDCLNVHQSGFQSVVALMGSSLSDAQEKFLDEFNRIIFFLDGDEAGRLATQSITARLISQTFVKVVHLQDGQQPDLLSSEEIKNILL